MDQQGYSVSGQVTMDLFSSLDSISVNEEITVVQLDKWTEWRRDILEDSSLNFSLGDNELTSANLLIRAVQSIKDKFISGFNIVSAISGGKDSNLSTLAMFIAAMELKRENRLDLIKPFAILHNNTLIESPEAHNLAMGQINEYQKFATEEGLPFSVIIGKPSIQQSWFGKILSGRGIPIFVNANTRDCAVDWKIKAGISAVNRWAKKIGFTRISNFRKSNLLLLLGSRLDESVKRAASLSRLGGDDIKIVRNSSGEAFLYPILNMTEEDVWSILLKAKKFGSVIPAPVQDYDDLYEFYSDSSGGECALVSTTNDSGEQIVDTGSAGSTACGTRSGCILCTAIKDDKSTIGLIDSDPDKFGYLKHLNRIQQTLSISQYNWNLRTAVGRTLYSNGYIELKHDTYSISFLIRILKALITADYLEDQRANRIKAKLENGTIANTRRNRRMSKPQFKFIDENIIIYLDFIWSIHSYSEQPFLAMKTWQEVYRYGELELLDDYQDYARSPTTRSSKNFLKVCAADQFWDSGKEDWDDNLQPSNFGLYEFSSDNHSDIQKDDLDEDVDNDSSYLAFDAGMEPDPVIQKQYRDEVFDYHSGEQLSINVKESDSRSIQVDSLYFNEFLEFEVTQSNSAGNTPLTAAKSLLKRGLVSLPKGQYLNRHYQAIRGQVLSANGLYSNVTLEQIVIRARNNNFVITDSYTAEMKSSTVKRRNKPTSNIRSNQPNNNYSLF
ncbi:hypothetical protein A1QO_00795 [Vibrio genomosp. F10 str. ZF-129]|uniref:Phosphoadenosine phosphosulphate reductase domain-containing protein n=1 Tax=Vibrio genomosp. F10 str. ZF-129 TaxID=1187848 RepID=A0A1E5BGM6_9VIBR|nr:hypothetical protein [Vibrio genomosp. F10]OEE35330.1 hypothetical protein A1QO_00795 [Vibrio genomosp. F10 str. ZF-129]